MSKLEAVSKLQFENVFVSRFAQSIYQNGRLCVEGSQSWSSKFVERSRSNTIFRMFVEVVVDMREMSAKNDESKMSSHSSGRFLRVGMEKTGEPRRCVG